MADQKGTTTGVTRRGLIGTAAAATAATALPASAAAATKRPASRSADVVVVGAGLAGIAAARAIVKGGRSVLLLEARDRVGGRTLNAPLDKGEIVEVGGQWVGPTQDRLLALAGEVGVKTFKTFITGKGVLLYKGTRSLYDADGPFGPIPDVGSEGVTEATNTIIALDQMAATVPLGAPQTAPRAAEWDAQTFATWLEANVKTDGGRFLVSLGFASIFATEPADVSLLFALAYIAGAGNEKNAGSFIRLINITGGAQESRFVGGSQLVSLKAAAALGRRVVLGAPARRIERSGSRMRVLTDKGTFTGKRVVVAVPPTFAGRIDYDPLLPAGRDQLTQRYPMGTVIKVEAVYDTPFWRAEGLAGYTNADIDPVQLTYDNSPPDGKPGVLLGFITGQAARVWGARSASARRAAVLANFAAFYGERARMPTRFIEHTWADERWSRGCYEGFAPPGVLTGYGQHLRAPVGHIHWAGTETATYWNGYMDGAVRSGERAAKEVLAAL